MPVYGSRGGISARGYGVFSGATPIATITLSNTSGSAISNYTFPINIPYNSRYASNFSNLRFSYAGADVSHWVATHTASSNANVYIKIPTLFTGSSTVIVSINSVNISSSANMFKTFTDFPTSSLPSGWEVVSNGAIRTGPTATNYTISPGVLRLCSGGGGPISILSTTADQGINIAVDTFVIVEYDTNNVQSQNSILEIGMHGRPTESSIDLTYGFKYRWDARFFNEVKGEALTRSRTNNIATVVLNQAGIIPACRNIVVGDVLFLGLDDASFATGNNYTSTVTFRSLTSNVATITTSAAHQYVPGDYVTISGVGAPFDGGFTIKDVPTSNTFTYFLTSANIGNTASSGTTIVNKIIVASVSTVGTQATITYVNTGANVGTTNIVNTSVNPTIPQFYVGVRRRMNQGFLPNPYGGSYTVSSLVNDAGWNNFDDPYPFMVQSTTDANGVGNVPAIFGVKYVGGQYIPYVNNSRTNRNFTDSGTRTGKIRYKALASNIATLTTYMPHGLAAGDTVTISGVDATFNGAYTVRQVTGQNTFNYAKTAADVASVEINIAPTSFSATSSRFGLNGKALVASHVGAAQLFWVAIYDTYNGVTDPVYSLVA